MFYVMKKAFFLNIFPVSDTIVSSLTDIDFDTDPLLFAAAAADIPLPTGAAATDDDDDDDETEKEIERVFSTAANEDEESEDGGKGRSSSNLFATDLLAKFNQRKPFKMSLWETKVRTISEPSNQHPCTERTLYVFIYLENNTRFFHNGMKR